MENNQSSFILFKTEDDKISVDVRFEDETVRLSQEQKANLFGLSEDEINLIELKNKGYGIRQCVKTSFLHILKSLQQYMPMNEKEQNK